MLLKWQNTVLFHPKKEMLLEVAVFDDDTTACTLQC